MKVAPAAGPMPVLHEGPSKASQDARQRAISKLSATTQAAAPAPAAEAVANTQAPTPVNPNAVAPEDITAIVAATSTETSVETSNPQTTETKAETTETKEDPALSDKYNLLARRERALRAKAQQQEKLIREREAALEAQKAEILKKEEEFKQGYIPKSQLKQAAIDAILAGELPYDEVTQQVLGQSAVDPRLMNHIQKLEAKIQMLESGIEETKTNYINTQEQAYKAAVKQIRTDVETLVKNNPEFETVSATNSVSDVVELIEKTFKEDGILMSVEEATQEVENYLVEEATRLAKLSKIQKRIQPAPAAPAKSVQAEQPQLTQPQPMKTLTNANSSTRKLSARERAMLAFKGENKS